MDAGSLKTRQTQLGLGWLIKVPSRVVNSTLLSCYAAYKFFVRWGLNSWVLSVLCR